MNAFREVDLSLSRSVESVVYHIDPGSFVAFLVEIQTCAIQDTCRPVC